MSSPLRNNFMAPPTIIPSVNVQRSHSIPIPRFTWTCQGCKKIMDINDDDLVFANIDKIKYCAKCAMVIYSPKPRESIVNRYVQRIIKEEIDKKKDDI